MKKAHAQRLLGPKLTDVARAVRCSPSAVGQWPEDLPPRIEDRVLAALARKYLPPELLAGEPPPGPPPADQPALPSAEAALWPLQAERRLVAVPAADLPAGERRQAGEGGAHAAG